MPYALVLFVILLLSACSFAPRQAFHKTITKSGLVSDIQIQRTRQATISPNAYLAVLVENQNGDNQDAAYRHKVLGEALDTVLSQRFAGVSVLSPELPAYKPQVDFLIKASLWVTTRYSAKELVKQEEEAYEMSSEKSEAAYQGRALDRPDKVLIQLQVIDARTQKPLDLALIRGRIGAFSAERGYAHFLEQAIADYLRLLT